MDHRYCWGEDWVYFNDGDGCLRSVRTAWTDIASPDPFVVAAQGRALMRVADLLRLATLLDDLKGDGV